MGEWGRIKKQDRAWGIKDPEDVAEIKSEELEYRRRWRKRKIEDTQ